MKYIFLFICLLACVISSFGELGFDLDDLLHKKKKPEPEPEPEPEPVYKPVKFKYAIHHDDDDDDHWGPPRPKYEPIMHIEHGPPMHFPKPMHFPEHHEIDDNWWWTTTPKPKKKKKNFIPKDLNDIIGGDFLKKLVPDLEHKK